MSADAAPALAVTGSAAFGVAVRTAAGIVSAPDEQPPRRDLAGLAAAACELAGIRLADVRELRVDLGPGSYTGLRVAVTFARFVHRFAGAALLSTSSLQLFAAAQPSGRSARLRPVLDGRRSRLHTAVFAPPLPPAMTLRQLRAPAALTFGELAAELDAGDLVLAAPALHDQLAAMVATAGAAMAAPTAIAAAHLFLPQLLLQATAPAGLEPLYLMGSYAD